MILSAFGRSSPSTLRRVVRRPAILVALLGALPLTTSPVRAEPAAPFSLSLELAKPVERESDTATLNVLRIGVRGHRTNERPRSPVNLALVLDRSGSMRGDKLSKARQAARMVVERLGPTDTLSVVAYHSDVSVLAPASRVAEPELFLTALDGIKAKGATALFAGVSRGLAEVRRFLHPARVDRVILLSDGQANVGPSAPSELGRLGAAAAKEGLSVTTIGLGLGYNEDLMARLAIDSDGNHGFAETGADLARLFDAELQDAFSVVAERVEIRVELPQNVKLRRGLNRPIERYPQHAVGTLVQVHADRERYFLLELEVPPGRRAQPQTVATVEARGRRMSDGAQVYRRGSVQLRYHPSPDVVHQAENRAVMVSTIEAMAVANNRAALDLRDQGRVREAKATLQKNALFLQQNAERYESPRLEAYSKENKKDAEKLDDVKSWRKQRKRMRSKQHQLDTQQSY